MTEQLDSVTDAMAEQETDGLIWVEFTILAAHRRKPETVSGLVSPSTLQAYRDGALHQFPILGGTESDVNERPTVRYYPVDLMCGLEAYPKSREEMDLLFPGGDAESPFEDMEDDPDLSRMEEFLDAAKGATTVPLAQSGGDALEASPEGDEEVSS